MLRFVSWCFLLALALSPLACKSNADKVDAFCKEWKSVVDANAKDCDQMGTALQETFARYEGVKLYGATDDEATKKAVEPCQQAVALMLGQCSENPKVQAAMDMLVAE